MDFENNWDNLISSFLKFSRKTKLKLSKEQIDNFVIDYISDESKYTLKESDIEIPDSQESIEYYWCDYLRQISENNPDMFDFYTLLNLTNIYKDTIFYNPVENDYYNNLNIYLDTPLLFALLGMDSESRKDSYLKLVKDAQKLGCSFYVLDNNFEEAKGILERAANIAFSGYYRISKANKVAQFFHNNLEDELQAHEFIADIEEKLNDLHITVKATSYDVNEHVFQEDEKKLFDMVSERYRATGSELTKERESSIQIDVRSIIMVYRLRQGQVAVKVSESKELFITINSVIANVSKLYESNQSVNSGHIPAAISADLLGTLIWLHQPNLMVDYKKKQLLADCYNALKPTKALLEKYLVSLENARSNGEIEEDKYLFLRSHPLVSSTLMNVINGDYSRFSDRTFNDVYEKIVEESNLKYKNEQKSHEETKNLLQLEKEEKEELGKKLSHEQEKTNMYKNKLLKTTYYLLHLFLIVPYILVAGIIELLNSTLSSFSIKGYLYAILYSIITVFIFPIGWKKINDKIMKFSEKIVERSSKK